MNVIPSEQSESRDLHLGFLTESAESTELGAGTSPPDHQNHLVSWMDVTGETVRGARPGRQFSASSALSVRNSAAAQSEDIA